MFSDMFCSLSFVKACALGNDFVIVWGQDIPKQKSLSILSQKLAHRKWGIGCDQVIYVYPTDYKSIFEVRFFNADGSEAEACGNGSRCVAKMLIDQYELQDVILKTKAGRIKALILNDGTISMALPKPVSVQSLDLQLAEKFAIISSVFVDVGNPHLVCFVDDIGVYELWGPILETYLYEMDSSLPQKVNVGFAKIINKTEINLNVWERGAGFTQACGTGACAAVAAAQMLGFVDLRVNVQQKGGTLIISLNSDHLLLEGEAYLIYRGDFAVH